MSDIRILKLYVCVLLENAKLYVWILSENIKLYIWKIFFFVILQPEIITS